MYELMLLSGPEYVDMYATSMKDRLVSAARAKARELQEAAKPGSAAPELEEALDAAEGKARPAPASESSGTTSASTSEDDSDGDAPVVAAS
jgi:1-acyl-sn-glycerol-3-phosphate acyltransferase